MNCKTCEEYMMKYFDGIINDIENRHLQRHLNECPKCSEEFYSMAEIFKAVEDDDMIEPPQNLEVKVMKKVRDFEQVRKKEADRAITLIYSISASILAVLFIILAVQARNINISGILGGIFENSGSFSNTFEAIGTTAGSFLFILRSVLWALIQAAVLIIKAYYYIFISMAMMVLISGKMILRHNDGGAR